MTVESVNTQNWPPKSWDKHANFCLGSTLSGETCVLSSLNMFDLDRVEKSKHDQDCFMTGNK